MFRKIKYIRTKDNQIIIFPETLQHSKFRMFEPISAGFISFGVTDRHPDLCCYGESTSLKLKPMKDDEDLAKRQILNSELF